jgi:DNA-binding transcriptional LysR family regulator
MRGPGTPSVDQLLVLLAVVEAGSFAAAARRLGRATSAISYSVDTLEAQLGLPLFDRGTARKPKLTAAGEAIVSEARAVAHTVETLRARVQGLLGGLESELSLVVDSMLPGEQLVAALDGFQREFPTVPIRLLVRTLGEVERVIRDGDARIGVGWHRMDSTGLRQIHLGAVRYVPVAAPNHPLASASNVSPSAARQHVQLVLSEKRGHEGQDYGVLSLTTWRVGDLAAKHELLLAGVGWGGMPEPTVRADLKCGRLVQLALRDWQHTAFTMHIVHKIDTPPGVGGQWLIDRLLASWPAYT